MHISSVNTSFARRMNIEHQHVANGNRITRNDLIKTDYSSNIQQPNTDEWLAGCWLDGKKTDTSSGCVFFPNRNLFL